MIKVFFELIGASRENFLPPPPPTEASPSYLDLPLLSSKSFFFISLETVADVDDVLGEMFLEEIQPTEEQLIVSIHVHVCTTQ